MTQPIRPCWLPWHHRWSKWAPYRETATTAASASDGAIFYDEREKRSCSRCGATQDRRIVLKDATRFTRQGW